MLMRTAVYRVWAIALVLGLCISALPPYIGVIHKVAASWSAIPGQDCENVFHQVWNNTTSLNSSLREEPRDIFVTESGMDLDMDMLPEIVVGDASGWFYIYESNGSDDQYTEVYSNVTGGSVVSAVTCGDLDGDLDMEIVTGGDNNQIRIYEWDNIPNSDNYTLVNFTNLGGVIRDLKIEDVDLDGNSELVVGWDDGVSIYEFNNTYHFGLEYFYATGHSIYSVTTGDFDGNMKMDVAAGEHNYSSIYVFESVFWNTYTFALNAPLKLAPFDAQRNALCIESMDLDGDGKFEIISGDDKGNLSVIRAYHGISSFSYTHLDNLGNSSIWDLAIHDADGDSKMDIYVASGFNASVFDYELTTGNLSYLSSYDKYLLSSSLGSAQNSSPCSIFVGDCDIDGKSEVIVGCFGNANDSMLFVLERDVVDFDVTVESINFPSHEETLPKGTYTINATLKNLGKDEATVNATCVIRDSGLNQVYSVQENIIIIPSGGRCYVAFDWINWTGMGLDTYDINVSIEYLADMNVENNYRNITLHILDIYDFGVGGIDISGEAPYGEGENISIAAPIHNQGNVKGEHVPVHMMINDGFGYYYNDTDQTVSIEAGDSANITFVPDWIPPGEGNYTVNISLMWNLDYNRTNNYTLGNVTVDNIIDISAAINDLINPDKIEDPKDGREIFNTNSTVIVNATIVNLGNKEETFDAVLNITDESNTSVFADTVNLTVGKGESVFIEFSGWDTGNISHVNYTVNVSVHESNENQPTDNNYSTRSVWVWDKYDLSATNIEYNISQPIYSNTSLAINSTIRNVGNMNVSTYDVRLEIRNSTQALVISEDIQINTQLNRSDENVVSFQIIGPLGEDDYTVNISVFHPSDAETYNNFTTSVLVVDNLHDIEMISPYFEGLEVKGYYPMGNHNFGATAYNGGNRNESLDISIKVGSSSGNEATLFQDDVESGTGDWDHLSWKGDDLWHRVNSTSQYSSNHSADTSWWFGNEGTGQYNVNSTALLYHSLDLRNAFYVNISFWVNYSLENGDDYCYLVINNDSTLDPYKATWTQIGGTYTGNSGGWILENINISAYAGQKVQMGFYVFSNVTGANYHGIYIDDIVVNFTETNFAFQNTTTIELESNGSAVITDSFHFAQKDTYIIVFESTLQTDESYCNDVAARKVNILDYYDVGTTEVVPTTVRKEEMISLYDFEGGNGADWVHGGINDDWARGAPFGMGIGPMNAHSPVNVWGTNLNGMYSSNATSWLRTPLLRNVEWGSRVELYIWYSTDMFEMDKLQFQVSNDGGNSWTTLREYTGSNQNWEKQTIPLGDFYKNIHCRFLFSSDDNLQEAGFYIDDFKIISKCPLHANEEATFNVTIENFGNLEVINPDVAFTVTNDDDPQFLFVDSFPEIATLAPGDNHTFAWAYIPPKNGTYNIDFSTALGTDLDNDNNGRVGSIRVWDYTDIQVDSILSPVPNEVVRQGDTIDIVARINNHGSWDWEDIPITFNVTSQEEGIEVVEDIGVHLLTLERNESGNVTHEFTVPYGQGVRYYINISGPFNVRLDMDFSNNIKKTTIFGLNLGELPALFGYVNSSRTGENLTGVTVSLGNIFGEIANTTTDMKGFYWFPIVMFGEMNVEASKEKYYAAKHVIDIPMGESYREDFSLDVNNSLPTVIIEETPAFALIGEEIIVGVEFGDGDGDIPRHVFNVSSNISGEIDISVDLNLASKMFALDTGELPQGDHRIFINVSDPFDTTSAYFDISLYDVQTIEEESGDPTFVWLTGRYGSSGIVTLESNTTKPENCVNFSSDYSSMGEYAIVEMSGQGRVLWTEIRFAYDAASFPPGSYIDDIRLFLYNEGTDEWEVLAEALVDEEAGTISINLTDPPARRIYAPLVMRDLTKPHVVSTDPLNNSGRIDLTTTFTIHFSELMDHASLNGSLNVTDSDSKEIAFSAQAADDVENLTTSISLNLTGLGYYERYTIHIRPSLTDIAGNGIDYEFFTFRTVEKPITTGRLVVKVKNETGTPLSGFVVQVFYSTGKTFQNKLTEGGKKDFEPPAGDYIVKVKGKLFEGINYAVWEGRATVEVNKTTTVDVVMVPKIPLPTWGILVGNVTDVMNISLEGVEVLIYNVSTIVVGNNTTALDNYTEKEKIENDTYRVKEFYRKLTTDTYGRFYIILEAGKYNLSFRLADYETIRVNVTIAGEGKVERVNITLHKAERLETLEFYIVDLNGDIIEEEFDIVLRYNNRDLTEVNVKIDFDEVDFKYVSAEPLPEGMYRLYVKKDGYEGNESVFQLTKGKGDIGSIEMLRDTDINPPDKKNDNNSTILIVLIIVFVLCLVLVLFVFLTRPKKELPDEREKRAILWFDEIGPEDLPFVGEKSTDLGVMYSNEEIPVPNGFVITRAGFDLFMSEEELANKIATKMGTLEGPEDPDMVKKVGKQLRFAIGKAKIAPALEEAIRSGYQELTKQYKEGLSEEKGKEEEEMEEPFVALRLSPISEFIPEDISEDSPKDKPDDLSEDTSEDKPDDLSEDTPEDKPDDLSENTPKDKPDDLSEGTPEDKPDDLSEDTPEDGPDGLPHSIFGEQPRAILNLRGAENIMDSIRKFYSPLFTDEALTYRKSRELGHNDQPFPIIVQLMVFSKGGGKLTTLNPTDGNRDHIDIKAIYGLSELMKKDGITPDSYIVDKTTMNIIGKEVSQQTVMLARASEGGTEELPVLEDSDKAVLSDAEIAKLAVLGNAIEKHFQKPMEAEWALDERDSKLWILQAEPETEWADEEVEETEVEKTEEQEKPKFTCPLCDEPVEETAKTCESCGAEFDEPVKVEEAVEEEEMAEGVMEEGEEMEEEEGMAPPPEEISMEEAEDIDLGALMGDEPMGELNLDLESLDEDVSISALDKMVSSLLDDGGDESEESLEIPDLPEDEIPDGLDDLDLDEIEIDGETDLDINLDDISIEDLEKSLDELGE